MNFFTVFIPAAMIAVGIFLFCYTRKTFSANTHLQQALFCTSLVLFAGGFILEFLVFPATAIELILRSVVVLNAIGAVVSAEVVSSTAGNYYSCYDNTEAISFNARAIKVACSVMTVVVASAITAL